MKIINSSQKMQLICKNFKKNGKTIAFIPTMGALHEGHLSLISQAKKDKKVNIIIVSIFVNPAQFGPNEDYLRYPRPFEKDSQMCKKAKVDYIFAPCPEEMYPDGYKTYVNVEKMPDFLCGASRPGHFRGVTTIIAKLFNIIQPDKAYFGLKDYQQFKIIERMARDLNFPVQVVPCPIIREQTGLALSSRNQYLSAEEKSQSSAIFLSLQLAGDLVKCHHIKNSMKILKKIEDEIKEKIPNAKIDYIKICDPETLENITKIKKPFLIAAAVWVGKTRLIDNIVIS